MSQLRGLANASLYPLHSLLCLSVALLPATFPLLQGTLYAPLTEAGLLLSSIVCVAASLRVFPRLIGLGAGSLSPHAFIGSLALVLFSQYRVDAPTPSTLGPSTTPGQLYALLVIAALALGALWLHWRGLLRWRATAGFLIASIGIQLSAASPAPNAWLLHGIALALMPHLVATLQTSPAHPRAAWLLGVIGGTSYALLCQAYSPLFSLCAAALIGGLLQGGLVRPRLSIIARMTLFTFCCSGLLLIAAIVATQLFARSLPAQALTLPILPFVAVLTLSALCAGLSTRLITPRLSRNRRAKLQAKHDALAARGEVVLRARVTGALHRTPDDE